MCQQMDMVTCKALWGQWMHRGRRSKFSLGAWGPNPWAEFWKMNGFENSCFGGGIQLIFQEVGDIWSKKYK